MVARDAVQLGTDVLRETDVNTRIRHLRQLAQRFELAQAQQRRIAAEDLRHLLALASGLHLGCGANALGLRVRLGASRWRSTSAAASMRRVSALATASMRWVSALVRASTSCACDRR